VANRCQDQHRDGSEIGIDCGDGICAACSFGVPCTADTDCTSHECDAITHVCAFSSCTDHKIDINESDVDCGGSTCLACAEGRRCNFNSDCQSGWCAGHVCGDYECADGLQDDGEADVDCGGPCPARCGLGDHCNTMADCTSNVCNPVAHLCAASDC